MTYNVFSGLLNLAQPSVHSHISETNHMDMAEPAVFVACGRGSGLFWRRCVIPVLWMTCIMKWTAIGGMSLYCGSVMRGQTSLPRVISCL